MGQKAKEVENMSFKLWYIEKMKQKWCMHFN
jgi:hypothetical protein